MQEPFSKRRPLLGALAAGAAILSVALAFVPAALEGTTGDGLFAYVVPTTKGPLPACSQDASDCTPANTVWNFIHVVNANKLPTTLPFGTNRATLPNALVIDSIDQQIFVDGVDQPQLAVTVTPPPDAYFRGWSGRWPATVTCPTDGSTCNVVGKPAAVPGEDAAVLYAGWVHGFAEPNGSYVFKYTIHGMLNGNAATVTASSPKIQMTD
jgi:hypothetical protein